jgi:hypothetical protein
LADVDQADVERPGIDRRTLIKRAAATGAVAWTAPLIVDSLASPAAAITCSGNCAQIQFPPDNTGACNTDSVAFSATCTLSSPSCSSTTTIGAGVSYGQVCMSPTTQCSTTDSPVTFTLDSTSTTCFTTTQASCPAQRQFLDAQAIPSAGACVTGVITGGTSVTFTKPAGANWVGFKFLIGCSCT